MAERGRPKKAASERLQPVCTGLRPDDFDFLDARARARGVSIAQLSREWLSQRISAMKKSAVTRPDLR